MAWQRAICSSRTVLPFCGSRSRKIRSTSRCICSEVCWLFMVYSLRMDGKLMRRGLFLHAARIRRLWRPSEFFERVCCLHCITSAQKAMRAGLRFQAVHWLPRGLADSNPRPANPSDVWANDGAYHDPPPGVVAKRGTTPSFRSKETALLREHRPLSKTGKRLCLGASSRFFRCRSSGRERTRVAIFGFQGPEKASF